MSRRQRDNHKAYRLARTAARRQAAAPKPTLADAARALTAPFHQAADAIATFGRTIGEALRKIPNITRDDFTLKS